MMWYSFPIGKAVFLIWRGMHCRVVEASSKTSILQPSQAILRSHNIAMKLSPRLSYATATMAGTGRGFRPAPMALLPPIPLYRRLFRAHRKYLPREMRLLGDTYIKNEFRAHRDVENPVHIVCVSWIDLLQDNWGLIGFIDWLLNRMANVRAEIGGRELGWREDG